MALLIASLGVGGLLSLIPPLRDGAGFVVRKSTSLALTSKEGKLASVEVFPTLHDGKLQLQLAPCRQGEAKCYLEVESEVGAFATGAITTIALGLLIFFIVGLLLHNTRVPSSLIAGRLLELDFEIDAEETLLYKAKYHGVRVLDAKSSELYMPLEVNVALEPKDGSRVEITDFNIGSSTDRGVLESPRFKPCRSYSGRLEFTKGAKEADLTQIEFRITKNFCLSSAIYRERWGDGDDCVDDFAWDASAYWDEIRIQFHWKVPPHIKGVPTANTRRVIGAIEEAVGDDEWDVRTWTLRATNVTPGRQFIFRWRLAEQAATSSQKLPKPAEPASAPGDDGRPRAN